MVDVSNFDMSSADSISQVASTVGFWALNVAYILLGVAAFAIMAWYIYREMQFKIPVTLHRVIGDSQIVESKDSARINKKTGEIMTKKSKVIQSIPAPKFFVKTLKSWRLYGRWDGHKAIQWQKLSYNSHLSFEADNYDIFGQMAERIKNSASRYKNMGFFEKYGSQIMMMTTVLVIAVVLIVLFDSVGNIGPSIQNGLTAWAEAVKGVNVQRVN